MALVSVRTLLATSFGIAAVSIKKRRCGFATPCRISALPGCVYGTIPQNNNHLRAGFNFFGRPSSTAHFSDCNLLQSVVELGL